MWHGGYWTVFRWRGSPVRLHWSLPLSALLFSRFRVEPATWLGLMAVVLVHELGHGALVRRYRLEVASIDLHGLGGECRYTGAPSPWQVSVIAWGGVLAQALLLPLGFFLAPRIGAPFVAQFIATFAWTNATIIGFNLLPIPPLDGADAWRLLPMWRSSRRELASYRQARAAMQRERGAMRARAEAGRLLRAIERHDEVPASQLDLPGEIAEQVDRAVRRALDEHKEKK